MVLVDCVLGLVDQLLALTLVELGALGLGDLHVIGIVVADEIIAGGRGRRIEEVVGEFVGIAALGAADHAPHGHVPFVARVPDEVGELRTRHALDLNVEAELPPGLGQELGRLELLRIGGLGGADDHELADLVAGIGGDSWNPQHGEADGSEKRAA